jgi:hypothetical protein
MRISIARPSAEEMCRAGYHLLEFGSAVCVHCGEDVEPEPVPEPVVAPAAKKKGCGCR